MTSLTTLCERSAPISSTPKPRAHTARDRTGLLSNRYIAGRGALLAAYSGVPADRVRFTYDVHRKPGLAASMPPVGPAFNVTHAGGLSLYAFTRSAPVGLGVEEAAYLQAEGIGLLAPLDSFDVSVPPNDAPALLRAGNDPDEPHRWSLAHLRPATGFAGAVAARSPHGKVRCGRWTQ